MAQKGGPCSTPMTGKETPRPPHLLPGNGNGLGLQGLIYGLYVVGFETRDAPGSNAHNARVGKHFGLELASL